MVHLSEEQHAIIDAAFKRIARYGHENTTMAQIAKDLGYSRTFLYYYFPDKESIFKLSMIRSIETYTEILKKELGRKISGLQMLENALKTKVFCAKDFLILGVYTNQTMYRMLLEDAELKKIYASENKLLAQMINKGKKDGSIIKCDAEKTAYQITDGLIGYMSVGLRRMGAYNRATPKQVNELLARQMEFATLLTHSIQNK